MLGVTEEKNRLDAAQKEGTIKASVILTSLSLYAYF
jgi:hypothetical protein